MAGDARLLRRVEWILPLVAAGVLAVGLVVFFFDRGAGSSREQPVPLSRDAQLVAFRFIRDAVQRHAPGRSYDSVAPELRRGYSLQEWRTGRIPIVPYPAKTARVSLFRAKYSYANRALIGVRLDSRKLGAESFELGLVRRGNRWLVNLWQPVASIVPRRG